MIAENSAVYFLHETISSKVPVSFMSLAKWRYAYISVNTSKAQYLDDMTPT